MTARLSRQPARETARLHMRPLTPADAAAFRAMTDHPSITGAVNFLPMPFTLADAEALLRSAEDECFWGVWDSATGTLVGTVGTHRHGAAEIEIGYWFAAEARGRGLAHEAVAAILQGLDEHRPGHRIIAECRPENAASWRLLERLGFQPTGTDGERQGRKRLARP